MSDTGYTPQSMLERTRRALAARGARPVVRDLARWGTSLVAGVPWTLAGSHGTFELDGQRYHYLYNRHKFTWLTERAVEVPVAQALVDEHASDRVLEIGNVLSHYRPQQHLVVDKYEQAPGVLNRDVLDLGGLGQFDLIVAISTLEHVGWDESPRDPAKAQRAVKSAALAGSARRAAGDHRSGRLQHRLRRGAADRRGAAEPRGRAPPGRRDEMAGGRSGRGVVGAVRLPALSGARGAVRVHQARRLT